MSQDSKTPSSKSGRAPSRQPKAGQASSSAKSNRPRRVAFAALRDILREGRALDQALLEAPAYRALEPRDRAFTRQLVSTTLRRLGEIDGAIAHCLDRPLKARLSPVQDLLRLGAAQILFLDTADHAAVSETVELAVGVRVGAHKGLVNAVLRRLSREGQEILATLTAERDPGRRNTPRWLWQVWEAAYGAETAAAIGRAHLSEAPLDLSLRRPQEIETWTARLGESAEHVERLPGGGLRLPSGQGDPRPLPGFTEGAWWVQDAAAQIPTRLLHAKPGERIADLCAAPGGKTLQLAAAGARVVALDRSEARLVQLRENLTRCGLEAEVLCADATVWQAAEPLDAVLLDAPCSATGTLRRHPDIARLKRSADVASLSALQFALLKNAAGLLKPGGRLVYAVCSLQPEEGPAVVKRALAEGLPLEVEPLDSAREELSPEFVTPEGWLRTLPSHWADCGGLDGFFACRLRRI